MHATKVTGEPGSTCTEVEFNMSNYFASKVRNFKRDTGATLRQADTPHAPKQDSKTFEANLAKPGKLDMKQCASHLMGALYGARMAHPGLSTAMLRLASHIHKWNAEC